MINLKNHKLFAVAAICFALFSVLALSSFAAYAEEGDYFGYDDEFYEDYNDEPYYYIPDKVTDLVPLKTNTTSVKIQWYNNGEYYWSDSLFEVCLYNAASKQYKHIAYTEKFNYTITNLSPNTKYQIAVREYYVTDEDNRFIFGDYSDILTVYTSSKAPTLKKASYKKTGKIDVKWSKVSSVKGYILQYSTSKSFAEKNTCTIVISDKSKKERTISNLFAKTYYVRICTYQSHGGRKYCSQWSKTKSVKVKKGVSLKAAINGTKTALSGRSEIKNLTNKGVDIKKYKTTYDRLKAIYNWHAKHYKDFEHCLACNSNFASCVNALYGDKKKYDNFIWISADGYKNRDGSVVMHKWCVLFINGTHFVFDPRLQGYTGNYKGDLYFGKTKGSDIGKKYVFDYWYSNWREGYKSSDAIITN